MGTPAYLAPEQIEGGSIDGRTDVYSLGCLLYECLTGETPFARGSRLAVAWAHLEEEPPSASERRPELPEAIDAVIRKAMAKEPEDRYTTCAALITAAEEALGLRRSPPLHRRKVLLLVAAVLVAALVAAALAAVLATGGHAKAAATPLFARTDTVARIDPRDEQGQRRRRRRAGAGRGRGRRPQRLGLQPGRLDHLRDRREDEPCPEDDAGSAPAPSTSAASPGRCSQRTPSGAWFVNGGLDWRPVTGSLLTRCCRDGRGSASTASTSRRRESRSAKARSGSWVGAHTTTRCCASKVHGTHRGTDAVSRLQADRLHRRGLRRCLGRRLGRRHALPDRCDGRPSGMDRSCSARSRASRPEIMPRGGDIWVRLDGSPGTTTRIDPFLADDRRAGSAAVRPNGARTEGNWVRSGGTRGRPAACSARSTRTGLFARSTSRALNRMPTGRASPRSRSAREASG